MSQVKRICAGLLAIMMLMSFLTVSAFAATPAGMEVTTDGESIDKLKAGDTVTVKLTLPVMDKLAGAQIELGFDKSSFEFQEKTQYDEDLGTDVKVINTGLNKWNPTITDKGNANTTGTVAFNVVGTANRKITTEGFNLLTIEFKVLDGASGSAQFSVNLFNLGYIDSEHRAQPITDVTAPSSTTVTIPKAPIASVTASVNKPVAGQPLATTGTVDSSAPYSISKVEWFEGTDATGTPVTDPAATAKANQDYTAKITLTANIGESFAEDVTPTVTDAIISEKSVSPDGKTLTFNAKFDATGDLPVAKVTAHPIAKTGLEYKGTEQALLGFNGTADGGTMQYRLDGTDWSGTAPTGKDAKTYTVYYMVKGDGGHSDSAVASISATIGPKDISTATIGTITDQSYTGTAITPDLTVTDGTANLEKDKDYTVSGTDNKYVGTNTAKLTITGTGNYTGEKNATFTIVAADQNPTFTTKDLAKGGAMLDLRTLVQNAKGKMIFTISGGTSDYAVLGSDGYTLTSTSSSGTVNINVRITTKDENNDSTPEYKEFSRDNAITVKVIDRLSDTTTMKVSQDDITYGDAVSPAVTNKPADTGTVSYTYEGRDGTSYNSATAPTNVGKYTVKATCDSSTTTYTAEDPFEILPKSISGMTVTLDNTSLKYNGNTQTVNVTSVDTLTAADYDVTSGTSGKDVGNYTVTVTGKGNYKDTAKATWKITPATLTVTPVANQSKKFKEADPTDLTYNCSGNVSGQTPAFSGKLNREAGENAGMYAINLGDLALNDNGTFKASNYTLQLSPTSVKFEIKKAAAPTPADIPVSQKYTVTTEQSKDIGNGGMPTDAGTLTYSAGSPSVTTGTATVSNFTVDDAGMVKYTITGGAAGAVIKLPVVIESTNYADATVNVVITLTKPSSSGGSGGSYTPGYTISVDKTENGSITVSPKSASKGDTVTITVKPDKGYELDTLKVLDKNGDALKLTEKNGKYSFTMPASKVTVKGSFVEEAPEQIFADVPVDAYYYEAVKWAAEKGITGGVGNDLFASNQPCTRAQIVTFLWRAAGSPEPKTMSSFADVPADAYYAKAVAWAVENGITGGTGDGKFSPDATCTRAQSVTFLYRANGSPAVSGSAEFSDVAADAYYADAVAWAAKNGVTGGIGGGLFGSDNNCTRAQIVTFLYRSVK